LRWRWLLVVALSLIATLMTALTVVVVATSL
jgi:hypothetical protein